MENPLINILIRAAKGRERELEKCLRSIFYQNYKKVKVIICTDRPHENVFDDTDHLDFIKDNLSVLALDNEIVKVKSTGVPFHWNFYCNNLKERVTDGWFFYLDDDDYLYSPTVLADIAPYLSDPKEGIICQFNRGARAKPVYDLSQLVRSREGIIFNNQLFETKTYGAFYVKPDAIVRGKIGGSAIFLHHSQKNVANWDGKKAADYRFIKAVAEKIPLKWVPIVVVQAGNNGRKGK